MRGIIIGFVLMLILPLLADAEIGRSTILLDGDTIPLNFDDTLTKDSNFFWIGVVGRIPEAFDKGKLQVDVITFAGDTATMSDTSYRLFWIASGRTEVMFNLYALINRYFSEKAVKQGLAAPQQAGPEDVSKLKGWGKQGAKEKGMNWRLLRFR
jgi:hypothetical protein